MNLRSLSLAGLLAGFALAAAPAAHAQTTSSTDQNMPAQGQGSRMGRMNRQAEMMKDLNLTDDQKTKVEALMNENRTAMMANRPSGPPDATQREAMRTRRADMETKMKAILTPEQYTKYQAMRPQRQQPKEN